MRISHWISDVCSSDLTSDSGRIVRFSAGADRDWSTYPIEFLHELGIAPLKPLGTLLGVDGAFHQASVMCREGGASSFGIPKSRACAIGLSGCRLVRAGTLRLTRAEAAERSDERRLGEECVRT